MKWYDLADSELIKSYELKDDFLWYESNKLYYVDKDKIQNNSINILGHIFVNQLYIDELKQQKIKDDEKIQKEQELSLKYYNQIHNQKKRYYPYTSINNKINKLDELFDENYNQSPIIDTNNNLEEQIFSKIHYFDTLMHVESVGWKNPRYRMIQFYLDTFDIMQKYMQYDDLKQLVENGYNNMFIDVEIINRIEKKRFEYMKSFTYYIEIKKDVNTYNVILEPENISLAKENSGEIYFIYDGHHVLKYGKRVYEYINYNISSESGLAMKEEVLVDMVKKIVNLCVWM